MAGESSRRQLLLRLRLLDAPTYPGSASRSPAHRPASPASSSGSLPRGWPRRAAPRRAAQEAQPLYRRKRPTQQELLQEELPAWCSGCGLSLLMRRPRLLHLLLLVLLMRRLLLPRLLLVLSVLLAG